MTQYRKPAQPAKTEKPAALARSCAAPLATVQRRAPVPLFQLQRVLGNRRVMQLIRAKRLTPQGRMVGVQRKLTVGAANDAYEQEADRVASEVLSMPDVGAAHAMQPDRVNKQTDSEPMEEDEALLQARSDRSAADSFEVADDVESRLQQSKGGGSPLPDAVRDYMEPRFGTDFSEVRVHAGSDANRLNRDVGAKAFTHGSDIYYGATESPSNLELTAHELTHVVQQTGGAPLPGASSFQRLCAECDAGTNEGKEAQHSVHSVQRTLGDGHDLSAARFAGDPVLEACFDNERVLRVGASGDAVVKLQQALVDAGFPLPKFGVDGAFGSETQAAVRAFQESAGVGIDGVVGPATMGALDARFAGSTPPVPVPPVPVPPVPPVPVPPVPVPPVPVPPVPVPPVPVPPVTTLTTNLQALIDARNTTYADYKAKIVAAPLAQRATVLGDTAMLRNIQGLLARNDFAKVVELLGRSAPSAATMLANATVRSAMTAAFGASSPAITLPPHNPAEAVGPCNPPAGTAPPAGVHEEGGWIYLNLITGALDTRRAAGGGQANINLGGPPDVADSVVVGTFHTHPNVGPCWGNVFPSGTDTNSANGTGVPWLIIGAFPDVATTQTTSTGPGERLHLAGNRGFPGATGGDAPQATVDGSLDEV